MNYWVELIKEKRTLTGFLFATLALFFAVVIMALRLARAPIYVIPGAKEGMYYPSSYEEEVVSAFAERIVTLYMNYNPANVERNVEEAAACFTPELYAKASDNIRERIRISKEKDVSQSFYVERIEVSSKDNGIYTVVVEGSYTIFAGSAPAGKGKTTITLTVVKGRATKASPLGLYVASMYESPGGGK